MTSSGKQALVGRRESRTNLKAPAGEVNKTSDMWNKHQKYLLFFTESRSIVGRNVLWRMLKIVFPSL